MATPIKKGTECYVFGKWNGHTVSYYRVVCESMGKRQGTARRLSGDMAKSRFYAHEVGTSIVAVTDVPDVKTEAMRRAHALFQSEIDRYRDTQHHYADTVSLGYHQSMSKNCRVHMEQTPDVLDYDDPADLERARLATRARVMSRGVILTS